MSLARSTMNTKPSSSRRATSPLCSQPSVKVAAVASGLFQYPLTTLGPLIHNSPTSPTGRSAPLPSTTLTSTTGTGVPTLSGRRT